MLKLDPGAAPSSRSEEASAHSNEITPSDDTVDGSMSGQENPVLRDRPAEMATAGVGKSSRAITGDGLVSTPVRTLFVAEENTVFDIQIPHAMNLFKAIHGRSPKSHEEFMQKIVKDNQIQLPPLAEGQEYHYDDDLAKLTVR